MPNLNFAKLLSLYCCRRQVGYGSGRKQPERLGDASGIAAFTMPALRAAWARTSAAK